MSDAPIQIVLTVSGTSIEMAKERLAHIPDGAAAAVRNAISAGMDKIRTGTEEKITEVYAISRANLRGQHTIKSWIRGLDGGGSEGNVRFSANKLPLMRFDVSHREPAYLPERVRVQTESGWKTMHKSLPVSARKKQNGSRTTSTRAFIAMMASGHVGIFDRDGNGQIHERMGLSVAQMAGESNVAQRVNAEVQETMDARVEQAINRLLNGG